MSIEYVDDTQAPPPPQNTFQQHPFLWLAILGVGVFIVIRFMMGRSSNNSAQPNTSSADSGNSNAGAAVDVNGPTGQDADYQPAVNRYESVNEKIDSHTDTSKTTNNNSGNVTITPPAPPTPPGNPPPHEKPPVNPKPQPPPKQTKGSWTCRYTVVKGDTLSKIASSYKTTWPVMYAHNKLTIDEQANAHHNPIKGGAWNNIFPGEVLLVPCK